MAGVKHEPDYHSYLVRLWRDKEVGGRGEPPTWRGELFHIQSGQMWPLDDLDELISVLKTAFEEERPA